VSRTLKPFYMVRLKGGLWAPVKVIRTLPKAMEVAFLMAEKHGDRASVLEAICSVEVVDGKPVWTDRKPKENA